MAFGKVLLNSGLLSIAMMVFSTAIENNSIINKPNYIRALHYDIKVRLYVKRNIYISECNSTIRINHETSNITMHFPTLCIIKVVLIDKDQKIYIPRYFVHRNHTVKLDFTHLSKYGNFSLLPGIYNLKMTYLFMILFRFRDSYLGTNGEKIMARIGTEVIRVQQLIPWPTTIPTWQSKQAFKATFNISVKHHHNYNVLSNMAVETKYEDKNDMLWTRFQQLPLMSAKHLTIAITTFSNIVLYPNIQFWCKLDMTNLVKVATTTIKNVTIFIITSNFNTKVSKLDYVLTDDSRNKVKTWGLILQRSADIIYDEKIDSTMRKLQIAHQIAIQMASFWYDDVEFLSKNNFPLLFGAYVLDQIQQSNYVMDLIVVQTQQEFLRFITPSYANPLLATNRSTINIPKNNLYLHHIKFFAIWRMLYYLISDNIFWNSIKDYINTYNYSNTTSQSSLWTIMESIIKSQNNELNINIESIINIWTTKTYYPVLKVMRDYKNNITEIVYITSSDVIDEDTENWIPVSYTVQSSLNFEEQRTNNFFLLNSRNRSHKIEGINQNDWIIINLQQIGYYRVNYDLENWNKLAHYLRNAHSNINVLNRAQIINDAYYFLLQQELDHDTFWYITSFLAQDTNYIAWFPMIKAFEHMMCFFPITHSKNIKAQMQKILNKIILQIRYYEKKDDTDLTKYLREEIIKWACILHIPECQKIANRELKKEIAKFIRNMDYTYLPSKEWVYCKGATVTDENSLNLLWSMWESTLNTKFLEFMACSENSNFIFRYLIRIKNAKQIELKAQYAYIFLLTVAKHVKNDEILTMILENLYTNFNLSQSKLVDTIATLIVIITHTHILNYYKIENFVKLYYPRKEQLFQAVKNKIRNRKLEYARLIGNYKLLSKHNIRINK